MIKLLVSHLSVRDPEEFVFLITEAEWVRLTGSSESGSVEWDDLEDEQLLDEIMDREDISGHMSKDALADLEYEIITY